MKNFKLYTLISLSVLLLSSCEDVIDVNLKKGEIQMTVDAIVTNDTGNQVIKLTESKGYLDNTNPYGFVTNATVAIYDLGTGDTFVFKHAKNGEYIWHPKGKDTFKINHQYALIAVRNTDTFFSISTIKPTIKIDSLQIRYNEKQLGRKAGNYIELWGRDLVGQGNTYWVKSYRNDSLKFDKNNINIAYDGAFSPGPGNDNIDFIPPIRFISLNDFGRPWLKGEKAKVEVLSIPLELFYYFSEMQYQLNNGGLFATPPDNLHGNIVNFNSKSKVKANGFFAMCGMTKIQRIIP